MNDTSEAYTKLMEYVLKEGYITQQDYLNIMQGEADENVLLLSIYQMEKEGVFISSVGEKGTVYYLSDTKFQ